MQTTLKQGPQLESDADFITVAPAPAQVQVIAPRLLVVLMHGYDSTPDALAPFAASLGVPAVFGFPRGPVVLEGAQGSTRAWWPVDRAARERAITSGPRDFAGRTPAGLHAAREHVSGATQRWRSAWPGLPLVMGGFSQGGMLACDVALHAPPPGLRGLVLLSSSRIAFHTWGPALHKLNGLQAFVSHGKRDTDLSFAAGVALASTLSAAGATTEWVPFDGGHEVPLPVWRQLRRFLCSLAAQSATS